MMHYYDMENEPAIDEAAGRPEFSAVDGEPAFYALCGADMRTTSEGEKCPDCAEVVARLDLPDQVKDGDGIFYAGDHVPQGAR